MESASESRALPRRDAEFFEDNVEVAEDSAADAEHDGVLAYSLTVFLGKMWYEAGVLVLGTEYLLCSFCVAGILDFYEVDCSGAVGVALHEDDVGASVREVGWVFRCEEGAAYCRWDLCRGLRSSVRPRRLARGVDGGELSPQDQRVDVGADAIV